MSVSQMFPWSVQGMRFKELKHADVVAERRARESGLNVPVIHNEPYNGEYDRKAHYIITPTGKKLTTKGSRLS